MLINIYQLNYTINGKTVQFNMAVDPELKPIKKVDDETVCRWRMRLEAIANRMFKE